MFTPSSPTIAISNRRRTFHSIGYVILIAGIVAFLIGCAFAIGGCSANTPVPQGVVNATTTAGTVATGAEQVTQGTPIGAILALVAPLLVGIGGLMVSHNKAITSLAASSPPDAPVTTTATNTTQTPSGPSVTTTVTKPVTPGATT